MSQTDITIVLLIAVVALVFVHFEIKRQHNREQQAQKRARDKELDESDTRQLTRKVERERREQFARTAAGRIELAEEIIDERDIYSIAEHIVDELEGEIDIELPCSSAADNVPRRVTFENVQRRANSVSFDHGGNKFEVNFLPLSCSISFNEQLVLDRSFIGDLQAFINGEWINRLNEASENLAVGNAELARRSEEAIEREAQEDIERRAANIVINPSDRDRGK